VLARAGATWRISRSELTAEKLAKLLEEILSSPAELSKRAAAAHALGNADAAQRLADLVDAIGGAP
jgi:UDP-N-acetylglucosamine--N-acetylmuramyl-(pentapeptide) pyrophosphoryl-undecaprenol N-acetylglucosamine transferase